MSNIRTAFDKVTADEKLKENAKRQVIAEMGKIMDEGDSNNLDSKIADDFVPKKPKKKHRVLYPVAASLALFIAIGFFSIDYYYTEASYVDMDVNPSIELKLNNFDRVIGSSAYNDEGEKILEEVNVNNKKVEKAIDLLLKEMDEEGYIVDDGLITLAFQTNDKAKENSLLNSIKGLDIVAIIGHESNSELEVYSVDEKTKMEAHELGLSCGKYLAYTELKEVAPETTPAECKNHSIQEIKAETEMHHERKRQRAGESQNAEHQPSQDGSGNQHGVGTNDGSGSHNTNGSHNGGNHGNEGKHNKGGNH